MSKIRNGVQFVTQNKEIQGKIRSAANYGIQHYKQGDFKQAEHQFVKTLKPLLSKTLMKVAHPEIIPEVKSELLGAMSHLGEIYARSHHYHNNYSKAAAIFQYSAKFADKYEIEAQKDSELIFPRLDDGDLGFSCPEYFLYRAYDTEREFLSSLVTKQTVASDLSITAQKDYFFSYHENILAQQAALESVRSTVKGRLEEIGKFGIEDISTRANKVEDLYRKSSQFFVNHDKGLGNAGFIQKLLQECYVQLGPPPAGCEHSVVALGSLSLGTMTPWSDLEFAILINEDREDYKEYFRNLTKLLHIKTINLGESPLGIVGVDALNNFKTANAADDWFLDDITKKGFGFDAALWHACKNPLGRQGGYKAARAVKDEQDVEETVTEDKPDYELILTPEEMAAMQFAEADGEQARANFASDRYLVQALRSNALIDGSQSLLDDYRFRLHTEDPEQLQILQSQSMEILKEDVDKFSLKLGRHEEGKLIDVKKGMYRLGDRVVNALASYYGIEAEQGQLSIGSVWQMIDAMMERGIINAEGAQHLKEAVSIATELRLRTYANNESQDEAMSTYVPAVEHLPEEEKHKLLEKTFHIKDTSILHHFYYVMLRLQDVVKVFCKQDWRHNVAEMILASNDLYADSNYNKGMVHARFLEYKQAIEHLEVANADQPENLQMLQNLLFLCSKTGIIDKAIDIAQKIQTFVKTQNQINPNHPDIANIYGNLGNIYFQTGEYDVAIEAHKQALEIYEAVYASTPNHPDIAGSYNNWANAYYSKGKYNAAIQAHNKALEIRLVAYASTPNHPGIADSYNNLGLAYAAKGKYDAAIQAHNKALEIRLVAYASTPNHPSIATSYNNLGLAYKSKGDYNAAIQAHKQALEIYEAVYASTPNHPDIASSYNNLGLAYYAAKGKYDAAIEAHNKALEIQSVAYASTPNHPDIAISYNNLGLAYAAKGKYDASIQEHNKALEIKLVAYESTPNHPSIAESHGNLGSAYAGKGDQDTAIKEHNKALEIFQVEYASTPNHPDIAGSYNNLGVSYTNKGDYDAAIQAHNKALEIRLVAYKSTPNHYKIADSYNNLGLAYFCKGEYKEALSYANSESEGFYLHSLIQLGNQELLSDNQKQAKEYYKQVNSSFSGINFYSESFIKLQKATLKQYEHMKSIPTAINTLRVLAKVDPEMHYGNHYHKLACLYACQGNAEEANQAFQKALNHQESSGLVCADYAQFLILNKDNSALHDAVKIIPECLYAVINGGNMDNLTYGPIVKNALCSVLSDTAKQKKADIKVAPKALAYYLLITHPEYMKEGDSVESLLKKFQDMCAKQSLNTGSFDEISAILLTDAYNKSFGLTIDVGAEEEPKELEDFTFPEESASPASASADVIILGEGSEVNTED